MNTFKYKLIKFIGNGHVDQVYIHAFIAQREIKLFYEAIRKVVKLIQSAPGCWS